MRGVALIYTVSYAYPCEEPWVDRHTLRGCPVCRISSLIHSKGPLVFVLFLPCLPYPALPRCRVFPHDLAIAPSGFLMRCGPPAGCHNIYDVNTMIYGFLDILIAPSTDFQVTITIAVVPRSCGFYPLVGMIILLFQAAGLEAIM